MKKKPRPAPYPCNTTAGGGGFAAGVVGVMANWLRKRFGFPSLNCDERPTTLDASVFDSEALVGSGGAVGDEE